MPSHEVQGKILANDRRAWGHASKQGSCGHGASFRSSQFKVSSSLTPV